MAEDVIELLDYLGWTKDRDLNVVGTSLGGMIATGAFACNLNENSYPTPPPRTSIQNTPTDRLARPSCDDTRRLPLEQSPSDIRNAVSRQADVYTRD